MKRFFLLCLILPALAACSIYAVVDTSEAIIVTKQINECRYEVNYKHFGKDYFMQILSHETYEPGDTLELGLKSKI